MSVKRASLKTSSKEQTLSQSLALTEIPEHESFPWSRWLASAWQFLLSRQGQALLASGMLALGLTLALGYSYLSVVKVAKDGITTTSIIAKQSIRVLDERSTELRKQQVRSAVAPIFKERRPIEESMEEALGEKIAAIQGLFTAGNGNVPPQGATPKAEPANLPQAEAARIALQLRKKSLRDELMTLLNLPSGQAPPAWLDAFINNAFTSGIDNPLWNRLRVSSKLALAQVLKKGLTVEGYLDNRQALVKDAVPGHLLSYAFERPLVEALVLNVLAPNLVVDEAATRLLRLKAEREVEPVYVTYQPGDFIIKPGEPLTELKKRALSEQGIAVETIHWAGLLSTAMFAAVFSALTFSTLKALQQARFFCSTYAWLTTTLVLGMTALLLVQLTFLPNIPLVAFPIATLALTLSILTHPWIGLSITAAWLLLVGLCFKLPMPDLMALLIGIVGGTLWLENHRPFKSRNQLLMTVFQVSLLTGFGVVATFLLNHATGQDWQWMELLRLVLAGTLGGLLSGIITAGVLPFVEWAFKLLTPFTLLELGNHDQPLLKRLQFEAPGTFHHSLLMASLSEAAAEAIGADALLTRVGCLYHDIGKMKRPLYFVENQAYFGSDNPHDRLTPRLSKRVITQHPKDSIQMGKENGLPEEITAFMTEHHGTLMCGYFYHKAVKEEGAENVDKSQFRYAGPKPRSRETAICMLADAAESAVRALKDPTVAQMEELINKIFQQRLDDGQFDECPITMKEMHLVKETFVRVLMGIQHNRINYQDKIMKEFGPKARTYGK